RQQDTPGFFGERTLQRKHDLKGLAQRNDDVHGVLSLTKELARTGSKLPWRQLLASHGSQALRDSLNLTCIEQPSTVDPLRVKLAAFQMPHARDGLSEHAGDGLARECRRKLRAWLSLCEGPIFASFRGSRAHFSLRCCTGGAEKVSLDIEPGTCATQSM